MGNCIKVINKVVIWGGNGLNLDLDSIDSHASVNAYFLTAAFKELASEVINIVEMDSPEIILDHLDADIVISVFQFGFTSRVIRKNKRSIYKKIRKGYKGKLLSIIDDAFLRKYYEDVLLTVIPKELNTFADIAKNLLLKILNPTLEVQTFGWSAEPSQCFPEECGHEFNVFIDHGPYDLNQIDDTNTYLKALKRLSKKFPEANINIFIQDNNGIVNVKLDKEYNKILYQRSSKVPWPKVISYYRRNHIFCVTHRESAGLAVVEAAMSGAKIYIPKKNKNSFINKKLLQQCPDYFVFDSGEENADIVFKQMSLDIKQGIDRVRNHKILSETNSWTVSARRIIKAENLNSL